MATELKVVDLVLDLNLFTLSSVSHYYLMHTNSIDLCKKSSV